MLSNIPSKSDKTAQPEFKHQKLCDLDYYSRFSREELETKHADILHLYEALKKDTRFWIVLSFALIRLVRLSYGTFICGYQSHLCLLCIKSMNIAEIIALLINIGILLLRSIHRIFCF